MSHLTTNTDLRGFFAARMNCWHRLPAGWDEEIVAAAQELLRGLEARAHATPVLQAPPEPA